MGSINGYVYFHMLYFIMGVCWNEMVVFLKKKHYPIGILGSLMLYFTEVVCENVNWGLLLIMK